MTQRFYSLDVFRGATVALMILVNNPGSWAHIYPPLEHAPWNGCTPTDLVFPFFLFAVGNALAFVMPRLETGGNAVFMKKVITRTLLIFAIGLFLNWSPFIKWDQGQLVFKHWVDPKDPATGIRILGVLQRIALAYFFASIIIYFLKVRGAIITSIILLISYWFLCFYLGNPADPYSLAGYFGTNVDKAVLHIPHMYKGEGVPFDPEGITSTMTAIVQVILGYIVGKYIREKGKTFEALATLFVAGCILIFAGFAWDIVFPINKKIWTSSYVLYTTGLAICVLGVLIYVVEFKKIHEKKWINIDWKMVIVLFVFNFGWALIPKYFGASYEKALVLLTLITVVFLVISTGAWARFFDVFGKNALFIFFISGFLPRILALLRWTDHFDENGKKVYTSAFPWFYLHVCKPLYENLKNGSLLYALYVITFYWFIVYLLDRKKIYIKV